MYSCISLEQDLSPVMPATAATTPAKPRAQQQHARELEVGRAVIGRRRRPHSFGEVQQGNAQPPCRWLDIFCTAAQQQSRVRACDLIPKYHKGGAPLILLSTPVSTTPGSGTYFPRTGAMPFISYSFAATPRRTPSAT